MAQAGAEGVRVTWWRSRYVQHLEAENAELRAQISRMLNPQWRYLLYGEQVPAVESIQARPEAKPEHIKLPKRPSWRETASKVEYLLSPEAITDRKRSQRDAAIKAAQEVAHG